MIQIRTTKTHRLLKITLIAIILLGTLLWFKKENASAQGFNIEVSPGKSNLTIQPGDSYVQTFRVGNYSGTKKTLYIYVQDFTVISEDGAPKFFEKGEATEEERRFALSQWIQLPSESIEVENNEVMEIDAVINVPQDAEAGGHYGAFFVQTENPAQEGTSIGSIGRIASLMLVNIPGDVDEEVVINRAYTDKSIYFEENPQIEFITYLQNKGNVHGIPVGAFNITGSGAFKSKSIIFNQDQSAVLPGAPERKISETFKLDTGEQSFIPPMGRFTIDLVARYGTNNLPLETTIFFWVLPAKFLAIAGLSTILGLFIVWRALLSFKTKK